MNDDNLIDLNEDQKEDQKSEKTESCCCSGDCCPPEDRKNWKIKMLITSLVIIAAIIVGGNSLYGKSVAASSCSESESGVSEAVPGILVVPGVTRASFNAGSIPKDADVVIILMQGDDKELNQSIMSMIDSTINQLTSKGKKVTSYKPKRSSMDYKELRRSFSIETFPQVILLGNGCQSVVLQDNFTSDRLITSFVKASMSTAECSGGTC